MENNQTITVAIAEDEQPIRQLIESHLKNFSDIEVAALVANGNELLDFIKTNKVTSVFLDIEMPDLDGLSTAAKIKEEYPEILIVFITGHTKYAAESYQFDAVDYITKPVSEDSIAKSINKIRRHLSLNSKTHYSAQENRILIKNNHEVYFLFIDEIIFVEKELKKTVIHTLNEKYSSTEPLHSIESKLGKKFFRCHKSFLVNIDRIEKVTPLADRVYEISFYKYPHMVTIRRKKFEELIAIITNRN